jgi:putative two-component system response regulator
MNSTAPFNITAPNESATLGTFSRVEALLGLLDDRASTESPLVSSSIDPSTRKILIVDDEPINARVVRKYLVDAGMKRCTTTSDALGAIDLIRNERPDLVLLDIMMPGFSGIEILRQLREIPAFKHLAVLVLTAVEERSIKVEALELGAMDFLSKPVDPTELIPRVRNALAVRGYQDQLQNYARELEGRVQERTAELAISRLELIHCLGRAGEYRDNDTGRHVVRVGRYAGVIARHLQLERHEIELIELAAPLHDVGKIGVPDAVLLKPGKLDSDEFAIIKQHCLVGFQIFGANDTDSIMDVERNTSVGIPLSGDCTSPVLRMAALIALTHHEKWDGSGYPRGLKGEEIPLAGRITAIADVFDALSTARTYKPAFPMEQCFKILEDGRGTHFDPRVVDAFFSAKDEILAIRAACADVDHHPTNARQTAPDRHVTVGYGI